MSFHPPILNKPSIITVSYHPQILNSPTSSPYHIILKSSTPEHHPYHFILILNTLTSSPYQIMTKSATPCNTLTSSPYHISLKISTAQHRHRIISSSNPQHPNIITVSYYPQIQHPNIVTVSHLHQILNTPTSSS